MGYHYEGVGTTSQTDYFIFNKHHGFFFAFDLAFGPLIAFFVNYFFTVRFGVYFSHSVGISVLSIVTDG